MSKTVMEKLPQFIETLGLTEEPMGSYLTERKPESRFSPHPMDLPTREKEIKNG